MFDTKRFALLLLLLMLALPAALAEETATCTDLATVTDVTEADLKLPPAQDITRRCRFNGHAGITELMDGNYRTFWQSRRQEGVHCLMISSQEAVHGVLIRWRNPMPVAAQVKRDGQWVTVARSEQDYASLYLELPGLTEFRLTHRDDPAQRLAISEITLLGEGSVPDWVPRWQPAGDKVDLMLLSAHPDDEVLWFGGLLPYYAGAQGKKCLVVCFAYNSYNRRLELLDSLWTCGVKIYPVLVGYMDIYASSLQMMYLHWDRARMFRDVCDLYRQYKPDVVVAHDQNGEYGHGAHRAISDAARHAVELAADETQYIASIPQHGTWQVPKVYIHLWPENQLTMDWHQPLAAFDGETAQNVARRAYACHRSQSKKKWAVLDGGKYDNALFGLFASTVGPDVFGNDLFENIASK